MLNRIISKSILCACLVAAPISNTYACTVLAIKDAKGNTYQGRTNEFASQLPDELTYYPIGTKIESVTPDGKQGKTFETKYAILGVTLKGMTPDAKQDTLHEAMNDQGLSFSALEFTENGSPTITATPDKILALVDFGAWVLGNFQNVSQVKQALKNKEIEIWLPKVASFDNMLTPLHVALYDRNGGAIVIEFVNGDTQVYDNPVRVMTNAPAFPWHVRNMDNYAFLTNVDKNIGKFNDLNVTAPDAGIALVALPSAQTAPGRFVKAAYYSNYAYKAQTPVEAIKTLSHVMNNFDRAKNMAVDKEQASKSAKASTSSEVTLFTGMKDLNQGHFYLRTINSINFTKFDMSKLSVLKSTKAVPLKNVDANNSLDGTDLFLK